MAVQLTHEDTYAFAEVLELLSFMDEESVNKIPKKLIALFETHASKSYQNHLSPELPLEEQRQKLIDELNSYGFNFNYNDLGLDKLRTLYYHEEKFSKNQNG